MHYVVPCRLGFFRETGQPAQLQGIVEGDMHSGQSPDVSILSSRGLGRTLFSSRCLLCLLTWLVG